MRSTKARPRRGDALTTAGILVPQVIDALPFAVLAILAPTKHAVGRGSPLGQPAPGAPWTKPALRLGHSKALTSPNTHNQAPFLARGAFLAGAGAASVDVAASAPF